MLIYSDNGKWKLLQPIRGYTACESPLPVFDAGLALKALLYQILVITAMITAAMPKASTIV